MINELTKRFDQHILNSCIWRKTFEKTYRETISSKIAEIFEKYKKKDSISPQKAEDNKIEINMKLLERQVTDIKDAVSQLIDRHKVSMGSLSAIERHTDMDKHEND